MNREQRIERDKLVIRDYEAGLKYKDIAARYNISLTTLPNIFARHGITPTRQKVLTKQEVKEAAKKYLNANGKLTIPQIAKKLGVSDNQLRLKFAEREIKRLNKYPYNEEAFRNLNDEKAAYYYGLLLGDGCISAEGNCCSIGITMADAKILNGLKKYLGIERQPKRIIAAASPTAQDTVGISFTYRPIISRLIELGVVNRKTWHLKFPRCINKDNIKHILRGYSDANGTFCFGTTKKGGFQTHWFLASTRPFLEGIAKTLSKIFPDMHFTISPNGGGTLLQLSRRSHLRQLIEWLYDGATIYMPRKKKRAFAMLKTIRRFESLQKKGYSVAEIKHGDLLNRN